MPKNDSWTEELIAEIAKEHKIILSNDDPVLVAAFLQKKLIDRSIHDQQEVLEAFKEILEDNVAQNNTNNQKLLEAVAERLIKENKPLNSEMENDPVEVIEREERPNTLFYIGFYMLGILSGVIGLLLFNRLI